MNTTVRITVYSDKSTIYTQEKFQEAFDCFTQVVKKYTRFDSSSELAKLNNSNGEAFKVSPEMFRLIKYMLELSNLTNGRYDPTIIDLLEAYGYGEGRNFEELNDEELYSKIKKLVESRPHPRDIILDEKSLTVKLAKRQRLDLGSVGKGYAIDLAYEVLDVFPALMINAGGDIRVKGPKPDKNEWSIGLYKTPLANRPIQESQLFGTVTLKGGSVCGSGGWVRRVRFFHHLLSPHTGTPINETSQSFVFAPTALEADAWATILFILGSKGLAQLEKNGYEGIVVDQAGKIFETNSYPGVGRIPNGKRSYKKPANK